MTKSNLLNQSAPGDSVYTLLGAVNFTWAQLDQISSGAYASLLKVDSIDLGITIGRIETQAKIGKMHSVARHRRDKKRAATLAEIKKELSKLRRTRNAVTRGAYMGKSDQGELFIKLPAEFKVDERLDTAQGLFVFTISEIERHINEVTKIAMKFMDEFDSAELQKLFDTPGRVRPMKARAT